MGRMPPVLHVSPHFNRDLERSPYIDFVVVWCFVVALSSCLNYVYVRRIGRKGIEDGCRTTITDPSGLLNVFQRRRQFQRERQAPRFDGRGVMGAHQFSFM